MNLQVQMFQFENLFGLLLDVLHDDPDQLDECDDESPEGDRPQVVTKYAPHAHLNLTNHFYAPKSWNVIQLRKMLLPYYSA